MNRCKAFGGDAGFTLIEMMVALFIFGMLASASVVLLRQSVEAQTQSKIRLDEMGDMRRFSALMSQDLAGVTARVSRDGQGAARIAFNANGSDGLLMAFSRHAPIVEIDGPVSSLKRVEYYVRDGQLLRAVGNMADGGTMSAPYAILNQFDRIEIRFRDRAGLWLNDWQPQLSVDTPSAIELSLYRQAAKGASTGEPLVMLFLVGGGR